MSDAPRIPASKQSEIVAAAKHFLALARSGKVLAFGYAAIHIDDDGDVSAGNNAVWVDNTQIRDALAQVIGKLKRRVDEKSPLIIQ